MTKSAILLMVIFSLQCSTTYKIASVKTDEGKKAALIFKTSSHPFDDVAYNHRSQLLGASSYREIIIWDLKKGYIKHILHIDHTQSTIMINPQGTLLLTVEEEPDKKHPRSIVRIWNLETGKFEKFLTENYTGYGWRSGSKNYKVTALAFSNNGAYLAEADNKNTLRIWDVNSGKLYRKFKFYEQEKWSFKHVNIDKKIHATALAFSPDDNIVYIGGQLTTYGKDPAYFGLRIKAYNIHNRNLIGESTLRTDPKSEYEESVRTIVMVPNKETLYVSTASADMTNASIREYDPNLKLTGIMKRNYYKMAVDRSGQRIFGYDEKTFYMLDTKSQEQQVIRKKYNDTLVSLYHIPNTDNIMICGSTTIQVWNCTGKRLIGMLYAEGRDWVVVANDGRFDGTKKGTKHLQWKIGDEKISVENFGKSFQVEGLIAEIFLHKEMEKPDISVPDQLAGKIYKITGDEIVVATGRKDSEMAIGQNIFCYANSTKIRMKVTFPMMTVVKCKLVDITRKEEIKTGMPVFTDE